MDDKVRAFTRHDRGATEEQGITLRQWYAGLAIQGLLAARGAHSNTPELVDKVTKNAIKIADRMVKELEKD